MKKKASGRGHRDGDTSKWLQGIREIGERGRERRAARIAEWASLAGEPHAEMRLGDDGRVGFWRLSGGIVRIRATKGDEFDPAEGTEIADCEILAIATASKHPPVLPQA